jgi:hypothetical protein
MAPPTGRGRTFHSWVHPCAENKTARIGLKPPRIVDNIERRARLSLTSMTKTGPL